MFRNQLGRPAAGRIRLAALLLLGALLVSPAPAYAADEYEVEDLGVAMRETNIRSAAVGEIDGRPVVYAYSNGASGVLSVLDAETGVLIAEHEVGPYNSFHMAVAPDDSAYISTHDGGLFRYLPGTDELEHLGLPGGQTHTMNLDIGADGTVYGGTFPDGHLFSYDPDTGTFNDYGPVAAGESYVKSVAYDEATSTVYAGTRPNGRLFAVDARSGDVQEIEVPDAAATNILYLRHSCGLLFAQTVPGLDWHVYDASAGRWIDRMPQGSEGSMTEVTAGVPAPSNASLCRVRGARSYFVDGSTDSLVAYNVRTRTPLPTAAPGLRLDYNSTRAIGLGVFRGVDAAFRGVNVIGIGIDGRIWHHNPRTGAHRFVETEAVGSPVGVHAISPGPDGRVYVGGYLTAGSVVRFDPAGGGFEQLRGPSQIEGSTWYQDKLYMSAYPTANVLRYDPSGEWEWGSNPAPIFDLGEGQDRAFAFADVGDRLAVGTIADSREGYVDGQLMFYNPVTGNVDRRGPIKAGHGIASLATNGSVLVGGTSMRHLAADPPDPSAEMFVWDLDSDSVVWRGVPVPGAQGIGHLTFDAAGELWGIADGTVFNMDLATGEVEHTVKVAESAADWGIPSLFFGPDGMLYGSTGGTSNQGILFSVDPQSLSVTEIAPGSFAELSESGDIYFSNGPNLNRLAIDGASS